MAHLGTAQVYLAASGEVTNVVSELELVLKALPGTANAWLPGLALLSCTTSTTTSTTNSLLGIAAWLYEASNGCLWYTCSSIKHSLTDSARQDATVHGNDALTTILLPTTGPVEVLVCGVADAAQPYGTLLCCAACAGNTDAMQLLGGLLSVLPERVSKTMQAYKDVLLKRVSREHDTPW
jgi:hypothetical protein